MWISGQFVIWCWQLYLSSSGTGELPWKCVCTLSGYHGRTVYDVDWWDPSHFHMMEWLHSIVFSILNKTIWWRGSRGRKVKKKKRIWFKGFSVCRVSSHKESLALLNLLGNVACCTVNWQSYRWASKYDKYFKLNFQTLYMHYRCTDSVC